MSEDNPTMAELAEWDRLNGVSTPAVARPVRPAAGPGMNKQVERDRLWTAFFKQHSRTPNNSSELDQWIAAGGGR